MGSDEIVQGFANSVPLAVALQQVLPKGYGFSIDQDVDLGTLVSFQGGKPWRDTLTAMLQPAGLAMREEDKMVAIGHAQQLNSMATAPQTGMRNGDKPAATNSRHLPPARQPSGVIATNSPLLNSGPYKPKPNLTQPSVSHLPPPGAFATGNYTYG